MAIYNNPSSMILKGAEIVAKLISLSYGAQQNKIHIERHAGLTHTSSAMALCNEIKLEHPLANIGVQLMRDICLKMTQKHGDGASTAILMAYRGMAESVRLQGDVNLTLGDCLSEIKADGHLVDLLNVICGQDTHASHIVLEALQEIGEEGTILIQDGNKVEATLEFKEGMTSPFKLASTKFKSDTIEGAMVAVFNYPLCDERDITPVLEESSQWPDNPLVIFTPYIVGDALRICLANQERIPNTAFVPAKIKPNQIESYLKDLSACANARFVCRNHLDTTTFDPAWFGFFRKLDAQTDTIEAMFYNDDDYLEAREARIEELKRELLIAPTNYDAKDIKKRVSYLDEGVAIIGVGGYTESERKVERAKYEKLVLTAQSASTGICADLVTALTRARMRARSPVLEKMLEEPQRYLSGHSNPIGAEVLKDAVNVATSVVNEFAKIKKAVTISARKGI